MISVEQIRTDYGTIKGTAFELFKAGKIDEALFFIFSNARIAYEYNSINSLVDDDLDGLLECISSVYFPDQVSYTPVNNRIVFYDYFAFNNRGLTQQYLDALIQLNYEILYVVENDHSFKEDNDIFKVIKEYPLGQQLVLPDSLSFKEKAEKILEAIKVFMPSKAFLHLSPWDIVSSLVFSRLKGCLHRYFINLTDHAFWLGKNLIDTSLEFRNFGYEASRVCRNIDTTNLQVQPYYPILQPEDRFLGMPEGTEGKVIGVSGGNGYKFLGDNGRFYSWVKYLLDKHPNFCFVLVGTGSAGDFFRRKIKKDKLNSRFFLVNDRPDIFQLLKRCDIYFGSYPFSGALMSQLAVMAQIPVVAYSKKDFHFNYIEDLFICRDERIKTFTDENEFLDLASKLIESEDLRRKYIQLRDNLVISKADFTENLKNILKGGISYYNNQIEAVPGIKSTAKNMSTLFLEIENKFYSKYPALILNTLNRTTQSKLSFRTRKMLMEYRLKHRIKNAVNLVRKK